MKKSGWIAAGAVLAVAAVIELSIAWAARHRSEKIPVKAIAPVAAVFQGPEITLTGAIGAQTTEAVEAAVPGVLGAWFVDAGAEVYEDQLVGKIGNADLENAVQSAQAAVDRAELRVSQIEAQTMNAKLEISRTDADRVRAHNELDRLEKLYQRYKSLYDVGALPRLTYEKTDADYKAAKADAANRDAAAKDAQDKADTTDRDSAEAQRALGKQKAALEAARKAAVECELHSPDDGVVLTREVHQGDKVEAGARVMTVATELTKLAVSLTPEGLILPRIHAGQRAFVRVTDAEIAGEVHEVKGAEVIVYFTAAAVTKLGGAAQVRIVF